MKMCQ